MMSRFFGLLLCNVLLSSLCFAEGRAGEPGVSRQLDFSAEPALSTPSRVSEWVGETLAYKLGVEGNSALHASESRGFQLNKHSVIVVTQTYKQIPIIGLESRLVLDQQQQPLFLLGKHQNFTENYSDQDRISLPLALKNAGHLTNTDYHQRLVYWSADYSELRFSYELEGYFGDEAEAAELERVYVDAITGKVLQRLALSHGAKNRQVNDINAACSALGIKVPMNILGTRVVETLAVNRYSRRENGPPHASQAVNAAFDLLGDGYDFIQQVIKMDSIDGNGRLLNLYFDVRFNAHSMTWQCVGDDFNAAWNSMTQSLYLPRAGLDLVEVTMHELGHGIITNGSNLEYAFEPGALNESIADTIGVVFRMWLELGKKSTNVDRIPREYWHIRFPTSVARDLAYPSGITHPITYPDHYDAYLNWGIDTDKGGVHYNSSIPNMAFYLLAQGGQHPRLKAGPNVKGIGVFKAVEIYAQAGAAMLQSRSNFEDARYAFARTAELLHGKGSQEWESVHQAMDAVGISGEWRKEERVETPAPAQPQPQPEAQQQPEPQQQPRPEPEQAPQSEPEQAPQSEPATDTSGETDKAQSVESSPDKKLIVFLLLSGAGLLVALVSMIKLRPQYADNAPPKYLVPEHAHQDSPARDWHAAEMEASSDDLKPVTHHHTIGHLKSLDGDQLLPLLSQHLTGRDGQIFGRALEVVHIQMDSKRISRRHLRFRQIGQRLMVEDLNSSAGTQMDGKALEPFKPVVVKSGQLIRIAEFSYVLHLK